jgi:hypothetical protein
MKRLRPYFLLDMTIGCGERASLEPVTLLLGGNGDLGEASNVGAGAVKGKIKESDAGLTGTSENQ